MIQNVIIIPYKNTFVYLEKEKICPYDFYYCNQKFDSSFKYQALKLEYEVLVKRRW
jgi:hypothetical protein